MASYSREHILAELRRTAEDGVALGKRRFAEATGIVESDWSGRYWSRWGDAVEEAGLELSELQGRFDDDFVLDRLAEEVKRRGRMPTIAELKLRRREEPDFPSDKVFRKFGQKREIAARLARRCRERGGMDDILAALEPLLAEEPGPASGSGAETAAGVVYLLKSGGRYKIGRTNAAGRREYELGGQLPQPARVVHEIETDDPAGVEGYWHRRFADKRVHREWFKLGPADVRAFKRWRRIF